ncbi:MAG: fosmidomycin resistance protein [Natrialbaceae archaeon]|nr:fosmidomycin resistance protein [Natrialbaceae archaeon]
MLEGLAWLALEVKSIERARAFYEGELELTPSRVESTEVRYQVGKSELRLRRPTAVPRGGVHTHYALSVPPAEYDVWWDRLDESHDLEEAIFGDARSLYCYDPDGHCVEIGQQPVEGPGIDGIFEVALEVASIERALEFYRRLGFTYTNSIDDKSDRIRMSGPIALELWEPRLGIADARAGNHVAMGFTYDQAGAVPEPESETPEQIIERDRNIRVVRDPDGHFLALSSDQGHP